MKKYFLLFIMTINIQVFSQVDLSAGMGISYFNSAAFTDYINVHFAGREDLKTFNSSVEFFIEGDLEINPTFQLGVEYAFSIYSYNNSQGALYYDISVDFHKPTLIAYYVIPGNGFKFKFGGGIGYRYTSVREKIMAESDYTSSGVGLLLRTQGFTTLGDNLYAMIGFDARYDNNGESTNSGDSLGGPNIDTKVNLNLISFAFKLGIAYFF